MNDVDVASQVDDQLVEQAVQFINLKVAESVFQGSLEIGQYLTVSHRAARSSRPVNRIVRQ